MKHTVLYWTLGLCLLLLGDNAYAKDKASRIEPNAFLVSKVSSIKELVAQVRNNPKVALRYERHFGLPRRDIAVYFEGNLKLTKLKKDQTFYVYRCDKNELISGKNHLLKAGTLVFADRYGNPILKASCGNPMTGVLPARVQLKAVAPPLDAYAEPARVMVSAMPETTFTAVEPLIPEIPFAEPPPPHEIEEASSAAVAAGIPALLNPTALAALAPVLGMIKETQSTPPVPEPCTFALMGIGAVALVSYASKRR